MANKHPAQGIALGLWMFGLAPRKGKSIAFQVLIIAFALSGRVFKIDFKNVKDSSGVITSVTLFLIFKRTRI